MEVLPGFFNNTQFCFSGNLDDLYDDVRWPEWQQVLRLLTGDQGDTFFPFLLFEVGKDVAFSERDVLTIAQL